MYDDPLLHWRDTERARDVLTKTNMSGTFHEPCFVFACLNWNLQSPETAIWNWCTNLESCDTFSPFFQQFQFIYVKKPTSHVRVSVKCKHSVGCWYWHAQVPRIERPYSRAHGCQFRKEAFSEAYMSLPRWVVFSEATVLQLAQTYGSIRLFNEQSLEAIIHQQTHQGFDFPSLVHHNVFCSNQNWTRNWCKTSCWSQRTVRENQGYGAACKSDHFTRIIHGWYNS